MDDLLKKAVSQLVKFYYREPGPIALNTISKFKHQRNMQRDLLQVTANGNCSWCNELPVAKGRRKYCSDDCEMSGMMYCNPQSPSTKAYLMIHRQNCACVGCGLDFSTDIAVKINKRMRWYIEQQMKGMNAPDRVTYHCAGEQIGDKIQVDHIEPIFKGGDGLGLKNLQILCYDCHMRKTQTDKRYK